MPTIDLTDEQAGVISEWLSCEIARTENVLWIETRIGRVDDEHRQEQRRLEMFNDVLRKLLEPSNAVS